MSGEPSEALERVYASGSANELEAAYADWAAGYDRETLALGYLLPFFVTAWMARHVPRGAGPILDAGCGTGLSGPCLRALGYDAIEGLDFSEEMLSVAAGRQAYSRLTRATLGERLPWSGGHFAAILSTGVFTEGHAPAHAFEELVRIVAPGGCIVATVRESVLEPGGFTRVFSELEKVRRWRAIEESPGFRAFAVAEPEVLVRAFVFEVC